jgi:hypothetical protein
LPERPSREFQPLQDEYRDPWHAGHFEA